MHREVKVDLDAARDQWEGLVAALRGAGATIEFLEPKPELPDLVFTANAGTVKAGTVNAGTVSGNRFVAASFRHPERQGEVPLYVEWFESHGYSVSTFPPGVAQEGAGDALPFGKKLLAGYRTRSDAAAHVALSATLGVEVLPVELVDPRFY